MAGEFAHYLEYPYIEKKIERAPVTSEVEVVIIGGGFGGLKAGARLREAGVKDIRIIKKGGPYGGGSIRFFELLKKWREDRNSDGLQLS